MTGAAPNDLPPILMEEPLGFVSDGWYLFCQYGIATNKSGRKTHRRLQIKREMQ